MYIGFIRIYKIDTLELVIITGEIKVWQLNH